jgi:endonuclease-3
MAKYKALTDHLLGRVEQTITLTFDELDELVGGSLPASGRKYQAYWANSVRSQPHSRAWLDAGRRARFDANGRCVHFSLATPSVAGPAAPLTGPDVALAGDSTKAGHAVERIGLVGCVKSKATSPAPAQELYTSAMFHGRRAYVERSCDRWFVLSAKHGLVDPDEIIEPYDVSLKDQPVSARAQWAGGVVTELERRVGPLGRFEFEIHAGSAYRDHGLVDALRRAGAGVSIPAEGMSQGQQLALYATGAGPTPTATTRLAAAASDSTSSSSDSPARSGWRARLAVVLERAASAVRGGDRGSAAPITLGSASLSVDGGVSAVVVGLLEYGRARAQAPVQLARIDEANRFLADDAFAFLVAVICDQGITAERAWAAPLELRRRIGHWDLERIAHEPQVIAGAFALRPALHRMVEKVPSWVSLAARRVLDDYGGDAATIWNDEPTAADLQQRLDAFEGIGQKKAAMAVEILERDLGVPLRRLDGSDIAYVVHVRRVFLRTGIATVDDRVHMIEAARALHPDRPGELDSPAWAIGREWCRPIDPDCGACPLGDVCPRLVHRAANVRGM